METLGMKPIIAALTLNPTLIALHRLVTYFAWMFHRARIDFYVPRE